MSATRDAHERRWRASQQTSAGADQPSDRSALEHLGKLAMEIWPGALALARDGEIVLANPRWVELDRSRLGWRSQDHDGEALRHYPNLGALAAGETARLMAQRVAQSSACFQRTDEGQTIELHLVRDPAASEPVALLCAKDVSQQLALEREFKALRQQMVRCDRMQALGQLAAGVAHDLKNTFAALALRARMVVDSSSDRLNHLEKMEQALARGMDTLERLERFSGQHAPSLVPIDLRAILLDATELARLRLTREARERPPVRVELRCPRLPRVKGNVADLTHLFVNLLNNARDAMPSGGTVTISAARRGGVIEVQVADEGTGIPPEFLPRIFDAFFTTKGEQGTGLGLSLALTTMQQIGGTIIAGNRPEGGARFTLRFPIARAASPKRRTRHRD